VAIETALTDAFGLDHPIAAAPMALVSGGDLAAAVSNAGGLGFVGGGYGDHAWMRDQLSAASSEAGRPWGVGLITWHTSPETVQIALDYEPDAFLLSFGDPRPYVDAINEAGCVLFCQVQGVEEARAAADAGADFIVAQGTEAGGHGVEGYGTLTLVPAVVDAVAPTPVLAAGGIVDGRGLAAALVLGAQGAMMGTRFYASKEALGHERVKERLVTARGDETRRTRVFDAVRGLQWPEGYTGRALRNAFTERWKNREEELAAALDTEGQIFRKAVREGDTDTAVVWAGEAVGLISDVPPAGELVRRVGSEAEARLRFGVSTPNDVSRPQQTDAR
jgi:nitronate monooxygenase